MYGYVLEYGLATGDEGCYAVDPFSDDETYGGYAGADSGGGGGTSVTKSITTSANPETRKDPDCAANGHPIETSHMAETLAVDVFKLPGEMGLRYSLYYVSPRGWYDNLGYWLDTTCFYSGGSGGGRVTDVIGSPGSPIPGPTICNQVTFHRPDGSSIVFDGTPGTIGNYSEQGGGGLATLTENADFTWTLHDEDGSTQTYSNGGALESIKDASGIGWTISHPSGLLGTTTVTATDGQSFSVNKTSASVNGQIIWTVTVTDPAENRYVYSYAVPQPSTIGHSPFELLSLTLPGSPSTTISYKYSSGASGLQTLLTEEDYNGSPYFYITYDSEGHAIGSNEANGNADYSIVYTIGSGGNSMTAAVTNPLGTKIVKQYAMIDGQYMITSTSTDAVTTCGTTTKSFSYDSNGFLTDTVDNDGNTHTYDYAANGQLQTETEVAGTPVARTTTYTWDPDQHLNRLLSVAVAGVAKTAYAYTAHNRLASVTRTNLAGYGVAAQTTTYAYTLYANGTLKSMTVTKPSPNGTDKTTYQYDTYGNLTSVTDALGHATTYSNYNALGEVGKVVGPNGAGVDYTYDARGRVATKITHPNGGTATWTYAYDGYGLLASVTAPDGEVTTWTRDQEMRVTAITHNDKDGTSTETFDYDANDDVISDVVSRGGVAAKSGTYEYDALGRVYQVKGASGQVLMTYAYDGNSNVLSATDALGHVTQHAYDALDRVITTTNAAGGVTHFTYNAGDHVVQVTDARGLVTTYSYDGFGQLLKQVSPDTGTTTLAYDAYGRLTGKTRADGTQVAYSYDALNRLTSATAGSVTRSYTWDSCANGVGRLCTAAVSGQSSVDYTYTPQGQVAARAISIDGGPVYTLGYGYDDMGHVTELQYPDGNQALYDYSHGAVADVRLKVGNYNVYGITGVSYQPMDLGMSSWTSYNGLSNTLSYDSDARLTAITVPGVEDLAFAYDAENRIIGITNGLDTSLTQTLGYDTLGRLNSVSSGMQSASYGYDADGNRITQTLDGATTTFAYAAGSNRLASATGGINASYGYDTDGNTTTVNGLTAYNYGPFNRLVNAGGTSYTISAEGQRLEKNGGGNTTYFAPGGGGAMLAEDLNGTWRDYVWLNGRLVAVVANGGVYPVATDQTGRPIALTAPNSHAVLWAATGLPFDRQVTQNNWGDFNIGFPGQYFDSETGLYQNGARDYDAALGRFIESDPIGLAGGVNTYAYVGNDPISFADPSGEIKLPRWAIKAGFCFAFGVEFCMPAGQHNKSPGGSFEQPAVPTQPAQTSSRDKEDGTDDAEDDPDTNEDAATAATQRMEMQRMLLGLPAIPSPGAPLILPPGELDPIIVEF
ncbi:MAG TPA: RHS repeat-associated core domain-containing protein [Rhodanobacteraceae bacterium]|nr:RHS repeat-associated core domain-containing protein [Rhodanobacteraceae bacterium]